MLWYKSLRETRAVTLVGIAAMAVACLLIVVNQQTMRDHANAPMTYAGYVWKAVYDSLGRDMFVILSIILGSGGLLQERAHGTAGFTLGLPVSRGRIVLTRAVAGYLGVLAIAAVPVLVVPIASRYAGQVYPVAQAAGFFLLWAGCGAVFYGFTFMISHRLEGEAVAVLIAIAGLMLYGLVLSLPWLGGIRMLDLFHVMNGEDMPFFNEAQHLLVGRLPLGTLAGMAAASCAFVVMAARRVQTLDF